MGHLWRRAGGESSHLGAAVYLAQGKLILVRSTLREKRRAVECGEACRSPPSLCAVRRACRRSWPTGGPRWRNNRGAASTRTRTTRSAFHPSRAARAAQSSEGLRKLWQSFTSCRQRIRGTSEGGRSGLRRATPSSQSLGIRGAGAGSGTGADSGAALADGSFFRGNSHSHWLRAPNPA